MFDWLEVMSNEVEVLLWVFCFFNVIYEGIISRVICVVVECDLIVFIIIRIKVVVNLFMINVKFIGVFNKI